MLKEVVKSIKNYEGLKRKKYAGIFGKRVCEDVGEDAAVIDTGGKKLLLFTADGVWNVVLNKDLKWGGFVSILVNVHDIAAMGGYPLYAVNVVSFVNDEALEKISDGMRKACSIYNVKIVNGHTHPNTESNSIDVAMIGEVERDKVIYSSTARIGDYLIYAVDIDGKPHPKLEYNFDSTKKDAKILRMQMKSMAEVAKFVSAGKDVSNAGLIGTIGMMMEVSRKGCVVNLKSIPKPENVSLEQWLKTYPAAGFIVSSNKPDKVIKVFERHYLTAEVIGEINDSKRVDVCLDNEKKTIFDFRKESILTI